MRIVLIAILIVGLCSASFAAKPDCARVTPTSTIDRTETITYWPPQDPVEFLFWEDAPPAMWPQYHGVWFWFKVFRRILWPA